MVGRPASALIIFALLNFVPVYVESRNEKTCFGTSSLLSVGLDRVDHYHRMVNRYQNCTTVEGNLEITGLAHTELDISFLKDIEVVTGYVIIALNFVPSLSLENLRLIRGRELYEGNALYISVNRNSQDPSQRMEYLNLKSLTEISYGNVTINESTLCFVNTIEWEDILSPQPRLGRNWNATIKNKPPQSCGKCDESCDGGCWGEGPGMCQTLTRLICSPDCKNTRCRGTSRIECCNKECSSGCTGPTDRDCLMCRHVNDSGSCQITCPPASIYDPQTQRHIPNPDFKYHFYDRCVDNCPSNLLVEDNSCVKSCRIGHHNNGFGTCVPCPDGICEKECYGVNHQDGPLAHDQAIHSLNIHHLKGCNIINGNLFFISYSFTGDVHSGIPPMNASQLDALKDIKNITGYLQIYSWHKDLHDFSAFENLRFIGGVDRYKDVLSLLISTQGSTYLTQITSLGFRSLKFIASGNVYIINLVNLCYVDSMDWSGVILGPIKRKGYRRGAKVEVGRNCTGPSKCDPFCSSSGCWGPGPRECLSCRNSSYNGTCLQECKKELGIYTDHGATECKACHRECKSTCVGGGPRNCTGCKHFSLNGTCVGDCPFNMYGDVITGECLKCSNACARHQDSHMCTGPNNTLGEGGCNYCEYAVTTQTLKDIRCLPPGSSCPHAHFTNSKSTSFNPVNHTCVPCYEGCTNCSGYTKKDCNHPLPNSTSKATIVVAVVVPLILVACALIVLLMVCRNRVQTRKRKRLHSMRALGIDTITEEITSDQRARLMEPMTPSGVAPNQAQLRIVKEVELRIGKVLGSGAFGTVHKGYWIPDLAPRERVKVPVAIKVLRDESSQVANNEILDEALVMASCEHPNLVRLLGISLAQRIMLITQLMPLGNLLDYVRENKDNVGSQHLLNWSLQIAKGMRYLAEEKHLVHRDLAARNVLVKSPNHVRITDFGLAKLLDVNEDVYRAEGGKMPIKWLALESIQQRIFTQKSDVWSFGVTMWELLTFGKRPYENVPAREVHTLLEKGERLPQPNICTIDIYMLLIRCWTVDMEARPTFKELGEELSRMARDPPRYIVIANEGTLTDLPSPTTSEFLRSLMTEEGDDFPITDAEEYLHQPAFDSLDSNGGTQFSLQPAPTTVPWKRSQVESTSSQQPLLGKQSGKKIFKWRRGQNDDRLDSEMTTMTSLSTFSEQNGGSSPFPSEITPLEACQEVVLGPDGVPMEGFSEHPKTRNIRIDGATGGRSMSDSSDVFDSPKQTDLTNRDDDGCVTPDHSRRRRLRTREDSTNLRYSAEPVARLRQQQHLKQQQKQQPKLNGGREKSYLSHDEEGYLCPCEAANKKPDYLDPGEPDAHRHYAEELPLVSAVGNPDYDSSFFPKDKRQDLNDYEAAFDLFANSENDSEYHNIPPPNDYQNLHLLGGPDDLLNPPSRRDSATSVESGSVKRDSGMQSGEESEKPKTAVSNPNYETLDDAQTQLPDFGEHSDTNYVNVAVEQSQFKFGAEDIFNANTNLKKEGRTYSEPDSGVEIGMDNIMYHKFPYT